MYPNSVLSKTESNTWPTKSRAIFEPMSDTPMSNILPALIMNISENEEQTSVIITVYKR